MLLRRIAVALVGIPIVVGLALVGGVPLMIALALVATLAIDELHRLMASAGLAFFLPLTLLTALGLVLAGGLGVSFGVPVGLGLVAGGAAMVRPGHISMSRFTEWHVGLFSAVYVGLPLGFLALLALDRTPLPAGPFVITQGSAWVILALVLTWTNDTAAYFVGSAFGRLRLAPLVSPRKTVEGTLAGLISAAAISMVLAAGLVGSAVSAALLGLVAAAAAVTGDLAESLVKRMAAAKDSGRIFPGHGGVLDRIDSVLFVSVVVALWSGAIA